MSSTRRHRLATYLSLSAYADRWQALVEPHGGRWSTAGTSVEGRPIVRYEIGDPRAPSVLLTSLVHGIELVGGLALFELARRLVKASLPARFVILPAVNPDAMHANLDRLRTGRIAFRRCNANGVDLNRNFGRIERRRHWHPFSGSRRPWSPHYAGPAAWSEPETRAVAETALDVRPTVSLGFHSFGNLLLYPWAFTKDRHPDALVYRQLGDAFCRDVARERYRLKQASDFYPTIGDMDDWLDHEIGTRAFTIEVGRPPKRLGDLLRLVNPFYWMNPVERVDAILDDVVSRCLALLRAALPQPKRPET